MSDTRAPQQPASERDAIDAARYRWLRDSPDSPILSLPSATDAMIDRALATPAAQQPAPDTGVHPAVPLLEEKSLSEVARALALLGEYIKDYSEEPTRSHHLSMLKAANEELADWEDDDALRSRLSELLTGVANALRGEPPPLTRWSWHDLPDRAAAVITLIDVLQRALAFAAAGAGTKPAASTARPDDTASGVAQQPAEPTDLIYLGNRLANIINSGSAWLRDNYALATRAVSEWDRAALAHPPAPSADRLREAILDAIDDCPGLTMEQDRWLSNKVRALLATEQAPRGEE
jgi:hypothetical protein